MISDRWKYDTTQVEKFLAKNFDGISTELITDNALLRLGIYILAIRYLKEGLFYFTEVIGDDKNEASKEKKAETISDWE